MYGFRVIKPVNCDNCGNLYGYDRAVTQHTSYTKTKLHGRLLLEDISVPHSVKKFSAFYGTRRFITVVIPRDKDAENEKA
jgi:hypothetical protein